MTPRSRAIDLNADVGEECGDDAALLAIVTSASIAAGAHAGGGDVLRRTIAGAHERGVAIGAHPSYPDRAGFGRTSHLHSHDARSLRALVRAQVLDVASACADQGASLRHVKAHGALYHDVAAHEEAAEGFLLAVVDVMAEIGSRISIVGPPASSMQAAVDRRGMAYLVEAFADRRYLPDGRLQPRSEPGSVLQDPAEAAAQALSIAMVGEVRATDGETIVMTADSLCLHGDTPGAVAHAIAVRAALEAEGIAVQSPHAR